MARSRFLVASLSVASLFFQPALSGAMRRDLTPTLPVAEGTTTDCDFWYDNDGSIDCDFVPDFYGCTLDDFFRWNPSLKGSCASFPVDLSYCVEGPAAPASTTSKPPVPTTTKATSTTSKASSTSSAPGNGIQTPEPLQAGIVDNCDEFYLVTEGEGCDDIAKAHGITVVQFTTWNSEVGSTCSGLWKDAYACVSVIGHSPTPTEPGNGIETPLPIQDGMTESCDTFHLVESGQSCATVQNIYKITLADLYKWNPAIGAQGNGIETPQPVQEGMTESCDTFHLVKSGQSCTTLQNTYKISLADLYEWNPAIGAQCTSLWLETYICVGVIGGTPTDPGNGIETPLPIQAGMTESCDEFHLIKSGQSCTTLQNTYKVSLADLYKWNPAIGSQCTSLWVENYVCVGVIGGTPTDPGNGIETPLPIQAGMVKYCKKFHLVKSGQGCQTLRTQYKVTLANLVKWNPAIGSQCTSLWVNTNLCVGV